MKILSKYQNYVDVFNEIDANKLSKHRSHNHAIKTKNKFFFRIYLQCNNLFIIELEILTKYLNDNLKREFIVFSSSSTKTLIMFVKKKDDDLQLCVSYRNLNVITVKNEYFI